MIVAGAVFLIFAVMMVLQLLYVLFLTPEAKRKTFEKLEEEILRKKI
jgi:hypothetical protein